MSLFSWFTRKPASAKQRPVHEHSRPQHHDSQARRLAQAPSPDSAVARRSERMDRRELLYTVVRDAMVRVGVLSASYKFKVLSLDQRGLQFLVMIDVAQDYGGDTGRLGEIESMIVQSAKTRFGILVTAVYWRINEQLAAGLHARTATGPAIAPPAQPRAASRAPMVPPVAPPDLPVIGAAPATVSASSPLLPPRSAANPRYDPIEADEVAAFKRALTQAAATAPVAAAAPVGVSVRSAPLLQPAFGGPTGFEDTELPESDTGSSDLRRTQYGDLN
jgi:hypothetical protein